MNVVGAKAVDFLLEATEIILVNTYIMLPSSVPSTEFETNGADFTAQDMMKYIAHPRVIGLGEVMCFNDVINGKDHILQKISIMEGKTCDGHAPNVRGKELQAYAGAGVDTEHECVDFEEALEKARADIVVLDSLEDVKVRAVYKDGRIVDDGMLQGYKGHEIDESILNTVRFDELTVEKIRVDSVAHDSHNIIAAGDNDEDIVAAVNHIRTMRGGYVIVSKGEVLGELPLRVAGLISTLPGEKVQKIAKDMIAIARKMGVSEGIDPFITLSFLALPVIPHIRLTDKGLFDVDAFQII